MAAEELKALVIAYFEALNQHDEAAAEALFADHCVRHTGSTTTIGRSHGGPAARGWDACPDWWYRPDVMLAEGDLVAVRVTAGGTHRGRLRLPAGDFPSTGRSLETTWTAIFRFQAGQVVEVWHNSDMFGLVRQLNATYGAPSTSPTP